MNYNKIFLSRFSEWIEDFRESVHKSIESFLSECAQSVLYMTALVEFKGNKQLQSTISRPWLRVRATCEQCVPYWIEKKKTV